MRTSLVILGLSITSSWGNGHATTYRSLVRGLSELGYDVLFLERDMPWYAQNRDCPSFESCRVELYESVADLSRRFESEIKQADAVIVGSYVPDGAEVVRSVLDAARGVRLFYDIDTPITLARLAEGTPTYIAHADIPELDGYLSFSGGPVLDLIERKYGAKIALPLYCSVDPVLYHPAPGSTRHALSYLGTYSIDRQPSLESFLFTAARALPEESFVVGGSGYPEGVWPKNVSRLEHVNPRDHAAFYGGSRFTLNVTREDMRRLGHSPSVRLFEAAACGVPIISDEWPGIESFLEPNYEILIARDTEDVMRFLRDLPERERRALGIRARKHVLSEHTAERRARLLDYYLKNLLATRREARTRLTRRIDALDSASIGQET
ncbi:MAG TPA: glycosyltransferase [Polyangiaceae bacterium]|jgi:spore maturation protein CgeB|nr:glycosyltransferase [Polyangiaceae bacterium]